MAKEGGVGGGAGGVEAVELGHALLEAEEDGGAGSGCGRNVVEGGGEEGVPGGIRGTGFYRAEDETCHITSQAETEKISTQREAGTDQRNAVEGTQPLIRGGRTKHELALVEEVHATAPAATGLASAPGGGMQQTVLRRAPHDNEPMLAQREMPQHRAHVLLHTAGC